MTHESRKELAARFLEAMLQSLDMREHDNAEIALPPPAFLARYAVTCADQLQDALLEPRASESGETH